jgi:hypothetical protein
MTIPVEDSNANECVDRNAAGSQRQSRPGVSRSACGRWCRDAARPGKPAAGRRASLGRQRWQCTITCGCSAQLLFGGIRPKSGYLICNNSAHPLYVSDVGPATPSGGSAIHIPPYATFVTPPGYAPQQAVSLYGPTTGQSFAARYW